MADDYSEIGYSGLKRRGGVVYEEFMRVLEGDKALKIWREMGDNDPIVGASLLGLRMYMRKICWYPCPNKDNKDKEAAKKDADFLQSCIDDMSMPFSQFVSEVLTMLQYGWSFFEVVYKKREGRLTQPSSQYKDGRVGWRKWASRSQDTRSRWEFDSNGGVKGLYQSTGGLIPGYRELYIPIEKALLFRTETTKNNPEGRSCLRNAYRPWWYKKRIEESEAVGIDRDLTGMPKMMVPAEWFTEPKYAAQLAMAQRMVLDVRNDEQGGMVLPSIFDPETKLELVDFELMSSPGTRTIDTGGVIMRKNQEIAISFMADVILLGHEKTGTQALAREKRNMLTESLNAWAQEIASIINKFAVPRLWELNGMDPETAPTLEFEALEDVPMGELADLIAKLSGAGASLFPDDALENRIRRIAGLPDVPEDRIQVRVAEQKEEQDALKAAGLPTLQDQMELAAQAGQIPPGRRSPVQVGGPGGGGPAGPATPAGKPRKPGPGGGNGQKKPGTSESYGARKQ